MIKKRIFVLKPHANLVFFSAQPPLPWSNSTFKGRLGYLIATEDLAIPKAAQEDMITGTAQDWIVREMTCGHNAPFLSRISETVSNLEYMIEKFKNT